MTQEALYDPLYVRLFGKFELIRAHLPLRLPSRKVEALFAYLVLHPQPQHREKLAALFWSEVLDEQARASLRNALAVLRRTLDKAIVVADRDYIHLNPSYPLTADVLEFDKQARMFQSAAIPAVANLQLDLYRGELLADFSDEWIISLRETYRERYHTLVFQVAQHQRSVGHYEAAITLMQQVLAHEPADEAAHQTLMACYFAQGDRAAALRQFETLRQVLHDEVGVEPQRESFLLYQRIREAALTPRSNQSVPGNLPTPITAFVGRTQELQDIETLICDQCRLVSLTGTGGSGKTRLAIEVAAACSPAFRDGVWWIDLAPHTAGEFVPYAIARVVGVREVESHTITASVSLHLRAKQALLVLDNCEHLTDACANIVDQLLRDCPHVRVLVTSREPLRLIGEMVWLVLPLSLPDRRTQLTPDAVLQAEAVQLFVQRVLGVQRTFHLTTHNTPLVVEICRQLDGIPLALELAAVCLKSLSLTNLAQRLQDRFALLTGGSRAALPRQQTLQATLNWSYDLLDSEEQTVFSNLAVFGGGFTLEAVEAICTSSVTSVMHVLFRLVEKSLVNFDRGRYQMLETVRQYALAKLERRNDYPDIMRRHLGWYVALVEQAEPKFSSSEQVYWSELLEAENANLRMALKYTFELNAVDSGLRLVSALWWYWSRRGYMAEIQHFLGAFLKQSNPDQVMASASLAKALSRAGAVATRQGVYETARLFLSESRLMYQSLDDKAGTAFVCHQLGWLHHALQQFAAAHSYYEDSLRLATEAGSPAQIAETLAYQGLLAFFEGQYAAARVHLERALALRQRHGEIWGRAFVEWNLGNVAFGEEDYLTAKHLYQQVLRSIHALGDRWGLPSILEGLAYVAEREGKPQTTGLLMGAAAAIRDQTVSPVPPVFRKMHDRGREGARSQMGDEAFANAWRTGESLTVDAAVEIALAL